MEENIIVLEDENGNEIRCTPIDVFDLNETRYCALVDIDEPEDSEESDVIIMKVLLGETPEDTELVMVEDDGDLQSAFDEFVRRDNEDVVE